MEANDKYKIDHVIGTGSFSTVFLGTNIITNQQVAIKQVRIIQKKNLLVKLQQELDIMQQFDHINIVKYYDVIKNDLYWHIIMEYCNIGTLDDVIKYNEREDRNRSIGFNREVNTYYYMNQLKDALSYLRQNGYIHRDIKPMNILLTKTLTNSSDSSDLLFKIDEQMNDNDKNNLYYTQKFVVKLADFGLARQYEKNEESLIKTICGSPLYMAPELLIDMEYNSLADLWSYGVIMYELLFGTNPNTANNIQQLKKNLQQKDIDFHLNKNFTPQCFDLLVRLLAKTYKERISWDNFLNHAWFTYWRQHCGNENNIIIHRTSYIQSVLIPNSKTNQMISKSISPSNQLHKQSYGFQSKLGFSNLTRMTLPDCNYSGKQINYAEHPSSYPPDKCRKYYLEKNQLAKNQLVRSTSSQIILNKSSMESLFSKPKEHSEPIPIQQEKIYPRFVMTSSDSPISYLINVSNENYLGSQEPPNK